MAISRRQFLRILAVTAGAAATTYAGYRGVVRGVYRTLVSPVLEEAPTGPLNDQTLKDLLAAVEAFAGHAVDAPHYEDFFRWRSEHLPGHRTLYQRFAAAVNRSARRSFGCGFAQCDRTARLAVLDAAFRVRNAGGRWARVRIGLFERDWVLFDLYIVRPIALLFAHTDAWRLVGYDAWPGMPRGLERYTQPHSLRDA
jgi:hypothetical protein